MYNVFPIFERKSISRMTLEFERNFFPTTKRPKEGVGRKLAENLGSLIYSNNRNR